MSQKERCMQVSIYNYTTSAFEITIILKNCEIQHTEILKKAKSSTPKASGFLSFYLYKCIYIESINHLALNQHSHVHEHIVEFFNRLFKLHNIIVSSFNIHQRLLCLLCVCDNL